MKRKMIAIVKTISWMLFILSFSIAVPIVCPPFYYLHINAFKLPEATGFTYQQIKTAYNEMLRFCIFGGEFSCGDLRWSQSGRDHFADCSVLFHLDFIILIISAVFLIICNMMEKRKGKEKLGGHNPGFWASIILAGIFLGLTVMAARDFDRFFVLFHTVFFPGKTNWTFDPRYDQIIEILPQEFFRNCAICIVVIMLVIGAVLIIRDVRERRNEK